MNEKVIYIFVLYLGILKNGNMQVYFFPVQTLCIHDDQFIFHCIEMCMKFQIIYDITRTLINKQGRRTSQCHRAMALVVFLPRLEAML